ncbi:ABC transporter permease [Streptomonospora sp. S1-112]|uniref:ABC transporter permease n=1 Tax=Streptomonospora mangrovi TaxID=2883123 RepID=A0A9X3SG99_9ACTN|nr:ABC transporter permease [Streptomonospora mangrovi]MDA0566682.1 ABC transporter permease [Streptomonospora mangrovi]
MTAPLDVPDPAHPSGPVGADPAAAAPPAARTRSLSRIAWDRLRRDRVAMAGGAVVVLVIAVAVLAPLIVRFVGTPPNQFNSDLIDPVLGTANTPWGGISAEHPFGVEPVNGRDLFSRVVYGARISILIGFLATLVSVVIGTVMGIVAGYFGGWVDALISRLMDVFLAFPLLLFAMALAGVIPDAAFGLEGNNLRVAILVFVIGFFNWPYIGRIIRGQTLSLREREFVEAARSLGGSNAYILFRELLPNLVAPILVYSTLLIPVNILFEAALSFLGVGINPPTAAWGQMLSSAVQFYSVAPNFMLAPGLAIFVTVLAFNLFGDGLRDAFDPRTH